MIYWKIKNRTYTKFMIDSPKLSADHKLSHHVLYRLSAEEYINHVQNNLFSQIWEKNPALAVRRFNI
jgi:hypothetical protein